MTCVNILNSLLTCSVGSPGWRHCALEEDFTLIIGVL